MSSLTPDDAFNIAVKLIYILVKISEWSETSKSTFSASQYFYLKSLSFQLANKFIDSKSNL